MEDLMTLNELAAVLRCKPKTLRNRIGRKDGSAPAPVKLPNGYNIGFDRAVVAAWIAARTDSTTTTMAANG